MRRSTLIVLLLGFAILIFIIGTAKAQSDGDPLSAFSTSLFAGSGDCASCHNGLVDSAGDDVSFDTNWRASTMANSARDPLWQAKVESEVLRTPSLQSAIEDKCATCHMPMARTQAVADGTSTAIFGTGFLDPSNDLHEAAMDGVSCSMCHQIEADNLGDPSTFSGHYPFDLTTTRNRPIYGKYADPSVNNMSGYGAVFGPHVEDSSLCATCHTLYTSAVDDSGTPVDGGEDFPEQVPYLEWEHSIFGDGVAPDTSCQTCHMPEITGTAKLSVRGSTPDRSGFGKHFFDGGNAFILSILRDNGLDLGVTASSTLFNEAITRSEAHLAQETGRLTIESADVEGSQLQVALKVENLAGHKYPTGIPLRRAWVHMTLAEKDGQLSFESGRPLPDGKISGNDADADQTLYEPHYDVIDNAEQVQIYEAIMGDDADQVTYTLLRATEFLKDNRLLPQGFDKATAPEDVEVEGAADDDANFSGGMDALTYQVPITGEHGLVTVSADLLYQSLSDAALQDLQRDSAAGQHVARFVGYYEAANKTPRLVAGSEGAMEYKLLHAGWNMISSLIDPQNPNLENILAPIANDLLLVKNSQGQVYWPAVGINEIVQWEVGEAYQIYVVQDVYFSLYGTQVIPEQTPIALASGWNQVAYLRDTPSAADLALNSCSSVLRLAKDVLGQVYWPEYGINQLDALQPGDGYQLYLDAPCALTYPPND